MKTFFGLFLIFILFVAPFLAVKPIYNYYSYYEEIARKYECYPIEKCSSDFNEDGKADIFSITNEPTGNERYNYRLKIFVDQKGANKEILNIKYDPTDNTFRTHIAILEENGQKKLIIYDTINANQFFVWNGNKLAPSEKITLLEREIQQAMAYEDDTGGFRLRNAIDLTLIPVFGLYYFLLLISIGMYLYFNKKPKLS
jgi:hypothetical protein